MSVVTHPGATGAVPETGFRVANVFGCFSPDGREFRITDWRTPRPWINVLANPRSGLAISHTGSGFSWIDNSQLATITRWQQEFAQDSSGKFVYARDVDSGVSWSLSPAPVWAALDRYECRHGLGYTTFLAEFAGIASEWTLFAAADATVEYWLVSLRNLNGEPRALELTGFLEWCCGVSPSPRREFHKLFIETRLDAMRSAIFARGIMWDVPNPRHGHWNTDFPYISAFGVSQRIDSAEGDKATFLGRYGDPRNPAALANPVWPARFGRHEDAIGALRTNVRLAPGQEQKLVFALAIGSSAQEAGELLDLARSVASAERELVAVRERWDGLLATHRVETPETSVNCVVNDWVRYQAIAGRLWARAGYYQQSGAFGFRDQLQDSQVWLTIDPQQCREQIRLHAAHQFADGSVYHWWHPLTEQGHVTRMTDDLLWLAFVAANFIRETGRLDILDDPAPFLDDATPAPLHEHVRRSFARVFSRMSPRGLPHIGSGDWNDGLSACGLQERGESIWLGHFLAGLLADWAEIHRRTGDAATAGDFDARRARLVDAINAHGWDGQWYFRATLDDGSRIGSAANRVGRIFLNAQTWAIWNDVAPPERAAQCWAAVKQHLISDVGALLLTPAYDQPNSDIGYITRYAPGLRENGGVYSHAATWAILAAAKMRDHETVSRLIKAINPANKDPERYWAEPYVMPGNVDGPESPYFGRGGWTWYTGSAAWLHRVIGEWVLGVRPEWDGLRIAPSLPTEWRKARMTRLWRGCTYEIQMARDSDVSTNSPPQVWQNGVRLTSNVLPVPQNAGERFEVRVSLG